MRWFPRMGWTRIFPPLIWLAEYKTFWLRHDVVAGVTLAAYAIPVSLAYAGLAGLPPQVRHLRLYAWRHRLCSVWIVAPVGHRPNLRDLTHDRQHRRIPGRGRRNTFVQIASLTACNMALLCLIAWLFKLSILVRLVSDSILVGFKAGAGLTIIMS